MGELKQLSSTAAIIFTFILLDFLRWKSQGDENAEEDLWTFKTGHWNIWIWTPEVFFSEFETLFEEDKLEDFEWIASGHSLFVERYFNVSGVDVGLLQPLNEHQKAEIELNWWSAMNELRDSGAFIVDDHIWKAIEEKRYENGGI